MVKLALIFPGQGAQVVGMAKDFYETYPVAKETFKEASEILGRSMEELIFESSEEGLALTSNCQVAIFVACMAIYRVVAQEFGEWMPALVAGGLSLGEYSALCAAGKISFAACLDCVARRGEFMQEASEKNPGSLSAVIGLEEDVVKDCIKNFDKIWVANLNCPGQVVIAGCKQALSEVVETLIAKGARKVIPLDVSGAFHSGFMDEAGEKLAHYIQGVEFAKSKTRVVSNVSGGFEGEPEVIRQLLIEQVNHTTRWADCVRAMSDEGVDLFIEVGCGRTLASMNKKIGVSAPTFSVRKVEDIEGLRAQIDQISKESVNVVAR
ncbi:MAG: Malonyl CoA-acyl carrier protein transacylase [Chlamydiia bacterium]|nr:Malonyl CoA-acyl carrier protein transacylase [Chlamydiia bacterium]